MAAVLCNALEGDEFMSPVASDLIDSVMGRYTAERHALIEAAEFINSAHTKGAIRHFLKASEKDAGRGSCLSVERMFRVEPALKALNAEYWDRALRMTDVLDFMPTKRREEWFAQIHEMETPEFEESTVRATLMDLMASRGRFLAERVDGIFQAMSRTHVTNQPEGFSKRMIMTGITDSYGSYSRSQTGHLNDLRKVVAKLMQRDEPDWNATNRVAEFGRRYRRGEWIDVDGGALRMRFYLNGNAHVEVHEDIAWQLNKLLATLHPMVIPAQFRTKPPKKARKVKLMERPLPFAVLAILAEVRRTKGKGRAVRDANGDVSIKTCSPNAVYLPYAVADKAQLKEARRVIEAIGGVDFSEHNKVTEWYDFDYDPSEIIAEIVATGCIPDQKSYQFYPTPRSLAEQVIEAAQIGPGDSCLEPSAGTGGLADFLDDRRTVCVEVSALHGQILKAKGFARVITADFLSMSQTLGHFDRVVMNPPFDQGRWHDHVTAAAAQVAPGGRLVAILPSGARKKLALGGFDCTWSPVMDNQFPGASVSVVILTAVRA